MPAQGAMDTCASIAIKSSPRSGLAESKCQHTDKSRTKNFNNSHSQQQGSARTHKYHRIQQFHFGV